MLTIVSGAVNSGKSSFLFKMHAELGGDGFVATKLLDGDTLTGYQLERLVTGETLPLASTLERVPTGWIEECRCGRFSFSRRAFQWGETLVEELLQKRVSPIFIDEVSYLELAGKGWAPSFENCLRSGCDTVVSVRAPLVQKVIARFGIGEFRILDVEENRTR